jgi:CRP/FNR family transcriptional regulator
VSSALSELIQKVPVYRRLSDEDRAELSAVCQVQEYDRGDVVFAEGDLANDFFTVVDGRVKVIKGTPDGKIMILEIFGPGDPVGAVAVYEDLPYPATAVALEPTICLRLPKTDFYGLLESRPSLVRGLLLSLTHRLVLLTNRLVERTGGRVETRFARLFLKLSDDLGRAQKSGIFIPMPLSRQDLADLLGTTVETSIRIMSRWGKDGVVQTKKEGFLVADIEALENLSLN